MMFTFPHLAVVCGDFEVEGICLLAVIPQDADTGAQLRALHILTREDVRSDEQNFWVFQLGRMAKGKFSLLGKEMSFQGGFTNNIAEEKAFLDPFLLSRGDRLALRVTPRGLPAPLIGLSVIPEWGVLSSRRSYRA